jgi:hypothetical protein
MSENVVKRLQTDLDLLPIDRHPNPLSNLHSQLKKGCEKVSA